jgi:hypothetical protein
MAVAYNMCLQTILFAAEPFWISEKYVWWDMFIGTLNRKGSVEEHSEEEGSRNYFGISFVMTWSSFIPL